MYFKTKTALIRSLMTVLLTLSGAISSAISANDQDLAWRGLGQPTAVVQQLKGISTHLADRRKTGDRRGMKILLAGPRNEAKSMTAEILAGQIGKKVYRVDLSKVVSKYIGETEKNLDRIFARAEESDMILFFDEADALFGKRTDVKYSHDRYANPEAAYLLKKIESYRGIVLLASNQQQQTQQLPVSRFDTVVVLAPSPPFRRLSTAKQKELPRNDLIRVR